MIPVTFAVVMALDNFAIALAGVTLVAYMSRLTSLGYTATQYALAVLGLCLGGQNSSRAFPALAVEALTPHFGLMNAYALFFMGCGADRGSRPAAVRLLADRRRTAER